MSSSPEHDAIRAAEGGEKKRDFHDGADPAYDRKVVDEPQLNVGGHGATQRRLRNYQVTMIGFTSGIGTGLFIGTGASYAKAGPAGLLLAFAVVGLVLWCVMQSIAELAVTVSSIRRKAAIYGIAVGCYADREN
jgi:yeast amino acid transporter